MHVHWMTCDAGRTSTRTSSCKENLGRLVIASSITICIAPLPPHHAVPSSSIIICIVPLPPHHAVPSSSITICILLLLPHHAVLSFGKMCRDEHYRWMCYMTCCMMCSMICSMICSMTISLMCRDESSTLTLTLTLTLIGCAGMNAQFVSLMEFVKDPNPST